ncbi:uncharacterized protein DDB_G0283697 [Musca vetustissima]|uniref:uncharacterized protein DDB_G0283697 n=1 Tax=Musca vetustissima TaxID=27455 RepID=UPI002AB662B5|nr:uncharacterized protein DDB_G0283697 [Musca vetustissima]
MIERGGSGATPNRLESHLFWPDDTKAESAVEHRLKRRNSVQLQANDKPQVTKQFSVGGANEVDTKRRFSKEFSQSSIQFYDNLNENDSMGNRRPLLRSGVGKKMELTEKPTATKLELPETIVDEAYTTAKRKQAYMSKIQFYDYINEQDEEGAKRQQNNYRKPKMDMNDKREMELNSKNSPKLQIKRDVRSLSEEKEIPKINNRYNKTLERPSRPIKEVNVAKGNSNLQYRERRDDSYDRSNIRSNERKNSRYDKQPVRNVEKSEDRYENDRDYYEKPTRSVLSKERNYEEREEPRQRYRTYDQAEDYVEEPQYRRIQNDTKKPNRRNEDNYNFNEEADETGERMRKVRIEPSPPRRHQYYRDEYYEDEQRPSENYRRNQISTTRNVTKRGNLQQRSENRSYDHYDEHDDTHSQPYEDRYEGQRQTSHKENVKRNVNKLNNEMYSRRYTASPSPEPRRTRTSTPSASPETAKSPSPPPPSSSAEVNKPRKHLRSSLCFHDGAIIAENDDATLSPTSEKPAPRRNIRSTATKRVSVGLPD